MQMIIMIRQLGIEGIMDDYHSTKELFTVYLLYYVGKVTKLTIFLAGILKTACSNNIINMELIKLKNIKDD
jgi:hypothetical protein